MPLARGRNPVADVPMSRVVESRNASEGPTPVSGSHHTPPVHGVDEITRESKVKFKKCRKTLVVKIECKWNTGRSLPSGATY